MDREVKQKEGPAHPWQSLGQSPGQSPEHQLLVYPVTPAPNAVAIFFIAAVVIFVLGDIPPLNDSGFLDKMAHALRMIYLSYGHHHVRL